MPNFRNFKVKNLYIKKEEEEGILYRKTCFAMIRKQATLSQKTRE